MEFDQEKAKLLAENLIGFMEFVEKSYQNKQYMTNPDMLFRLRNLVDEYRFQLHAEEILRINRYLWDEKATSTLIKRVRKGLNSIDEYIGNNMDELFIFSARLYTLQSICRSFTTI